MAECQTTNCGGNHTEKCKGSGRLFAFNFTCLETPPPSDPQVRPA